MAEGQLRSSEGFERRRGGRRDAAPEAPSGLRVPPHSLEAERAVLGGVMLDNRALDRAFELLDIEDFYREAHRRIFEVMLELSKRNEPVDVLTVADQLKSKNALEQIGDYAYLTELQDQVPSAANLAHYAKIVGDKAKLRKMIGVATEIAAAGFEEPSDVAEFIDQAEAQIFGVSGDHQAGTMARIDEVLRETFLQIDKLQNMGGGGITGVPSGFADLDGITSGFQPSNLVIVAARPSMGKTSFVLNIMQNAALADDTTVLFFSLEMSKEDLALRMLSTEARVKAWDIRTGQVRRDDWPLLTQAASRLSQAKIFIDDTAGITPMQMRTLARRVQSEHGLGMIIVDYLQLMKTHGKVESRERQISEISGSLKAIAKEMKIPVLALSQLNRDVEKREDKRPQMGDLRESGAIEQDADLIMFIYRDEFYRPNTDEPGVAEILIRKHRNGSIGTSRLAFLKEFTRFENLAHQDEPYGG